MVWIRWIQRIIVSGVARDEDEIEMKMKRTAA